MFSTVLVQFWNPDLALGGLESPPPVIMGSLTHPDEDRSTHPEGMSSHVEGKLPAGWHCLYTRLTVFEFLLVRKYTHFPFFLWNVYHPWCWGILYPCSFNETFLKCHGWGKWNPTGIAPKLAFFSVSHTTRDDIKMLRKTYTSCCQEAVSCHGRALGPYKVGTLTWQPLLREPGPHRKPGEAIPQITHLDWLWQ